MSGDTPTGLTRSKARTASEPATCQVLDPYVATLPIEFQSLATSLRAVRGKGPINSTRGASSDCMGLAHGCAFQHSACSPRPSRKGSIKERNPKVVGAVQLLNVPDNRLPERPASYTP